MPAATQRYITFAKADTEAQPELAGAARITSIPTLMAFRDGILVFMRSMRCSARQLWPRLAW